MSKAFITGSRAYGAPREDSDLDLVIRVSIEDAQALIDFAENEGFELRDYEDMQSISVCFCGLNLILCLTGAAELAWTEATERCKAEGLTSREDAIAIHKAVRAKYYPKGTSQ